jgi:leukotriene-A4 hydrolase
MNFVLPFFPTTFAAVILSIFHGDAQLPQDQQLKFTVIDSHSFAKPDEAVVRHMDLDLFVDFSTKVISGKAELQIINKSGAGKLHLDSRGLIIEKVTLGKEEETTGFELGSEVQYLGQALIINIKPATVQVNIYYTTRPDAAALQWLEPSQTADKTHPYLFTQSQAILARTWIPCQDSPGIKFTYKARISTDPSLMALMSAENDTVLHVDGIYLFNMPQPVPSYLMALTVGKLQFKTLGRNSGVYAEPSMIEKCASEFADLQSMIDNAEKIYGEYRWGRYDVVVLPPSFPFGGMENPRLTFATPTIIAGDRSLVSLIAHELAHSWSGNLVTNATWNDFWLNEGFTVYFESRIMEKVYGKDYAAMLEVLGYYELQNTLKDLGENNPDTRLLLDLEGRDPDDGVSDIAYEKGRFFLKHIERSVGREKFDLFLNNYFSGHAFGSITTAEFLKNMEEELIRGDGELAAKIDANTWINGTGLPVSCPIPVSEELKKVEKQAAKFHKSGSGTVRIKTKNWTTHHWLHFLRNLKNLTPEQMRQLDNNYGFTASGNSEILCDWFKHVIRNNYREAFPALEKFLINVGRRKFVQPLYTLLVQTHEGMEWARQVYAKAGPGYHSVTRHTIDEILNR